MASKKARERPDMVRMWVRISKEALGLVNLMENARGGDHARPGILEEAIRHQYARDPLLEEYRRLATRKAASHGSGQGQDS